MNDQILQPFEEVWRQHFAALDEALTETGEELRELLRLDEHHRHGHDTRQLERALGPFAAGNLDTGSLSKVLDDSTRSRAMPDERLQRVNGLIWTLDELKEAFAKAPADSVSIDIDRDEDEILELAEEHLNRVARVFRTLRIAQLEIRSKYESEIHDALFADFDWSQLGPGELRLCPPFVVIAQLDDDKGGVLRKMMSLLESRMPIKVAALRSSFREAYTTTSDTGVPPTMTLETLPLAMRGVYFVQTCVAAENYQQQLLDGLTAPRPAVLSIFRAGSGEDQNAFQQRAEQAVRARAFPLCVYDPDQTGGFVGCFDLSANPSPDVLWITDKIEDTNAEGEPIETEEPFTFAHFAASESDLSEEFTFAPAADDSLVPIAEYLELTRRQQIGKTPFARTARSAVGPCRS